MSRFISFGVLLFLLSTSAHAYIWSSAVPTEIHMVPNGMILLGAFDNAEVTCATAASAVYIPKTASNFEMKLSIALTAKATGKKITVLIDEPFASNCIQISAMGFVPIAHDYYFQLKN